MILDFITSHIEIGELFIEYRKNSCVEKDGEQCSFCISAKDSAYNGPSPIKPFPKPFPGDNFHYKSAKDTPTDGRQTDDYQPRAQVKKLFNSGMISSTNHECITEFSERFIVRVDTVREYVEHLEMLKLGKEKRLQSAQKKREETAEKTYGEYNWNQLFEQNLIEKQTVPTLDKYIAHHKLGHFKYKWEKVQAIQRHIAVKLTIPDTEDLENDIVLESYSDSDDKDSDGSSESEGESGSSDSGGENESSDNGGESESSEISFERNIQSRGSSSRRNVRMPSKYRDYSLI